MAPSKAGCNSSAEINWTDTQLNGHEYAKIVQKKLQAWWWTHGFSTRPKGNASRQFWCCKHCNKSGDDCKHVYEITKGRNGPRRHLLSSHNIERSTSEGTRAPLQENQVLNLSVFRNLVLQWIVYDNIAFRTVESKHFRAILTYLEGRLEGNIGSRRSVKRWILDAYGKHTKAIKAELAKSQSLIHLSFDLWTSRSLLSLNGIVVHFVDEGFEPRTFLLALPEQEDEHTGTNIANTVCNLLTVNIDDSPIEKTDNRNRYLEPWKIIESGRKPDISL